jgi:hypothetical protein
MRPAISCNDGAGESQAADMDQEPRWIAAWLPSDPVALSAIETLEPHIRSLVRPRWQTLPPAPGQRSTGLSNSVAYVDVDSSTDLSSIADGIPVVPFDEAPLLTQLVASGSSHLALSLPVVRFEDQRLVAAQLGESLRSVPDTVHLDLFIDVSVESSIRVAEAVAAGAARRVPHSARWTAIVMCFRADPPEPLALRELPRPRRDRWARGLSPRVSSGEAVSFPKNVLAYLLGDRWIVATPMTAGSAQVLAQLLVHNVDFSGTECCAGDRWLYEASIGNVDANNRARWRWATLVHWLTSTVALSPAGAHPGGCG